MHHHSDRRELDCWRERPHRRCRGGDRRARDGESWRERQIQMVGLASARRRERQLARAAAGERETARWWRRRIVLEGEADGGDGEMEQMVVLPYAESGFRMIVPIKDDDFTESSWWFLRPLTPELWLITIAFFFMKSILVWLFEREINSDFQGTFSQQVGKLSSQREEPEIAERTTRDRRRKRRERRDRRDERERRDRRENNQRSQRTEIKQPEIAERNRMGDQTTRDRREKSRN
ncbi:hypothetical protein Syun_012097 [Stephania yunnanensis]|uniref:Uncharacterized protein n=1 Tax=Stephania yunnanensis TaxID=152371 RepID=A0AAP0K198_9MAGN